jgi:CrcB protein
MSAAIWLAFLAAAIIGAIARYLLGGLVQDATGNTFPWGTCLINVSGSLALGVLTGLVLYHGVDTDVRLVLGTGFCGAYTTFSTFSYDTVELALAGDTRRAVRNVALNTLGGILAAAIGLALVGSL